MASSGYALTIGTDAPSAVDRDTLAVVLDTRACLASPGSAQPLAAALEAACHASGASRVDVWCRLGGRKIEALVHADVRNTVERNVLSAVRDTRARASSNRAVGQTNARATAPVVEKDGFARGVGLAGPVTARRHIGGGAVERGPIIGLAAVRGAATGALAQVASAHAFARDGALSRQNHRLPNTVGLAIG